MRTLQESISTHQARFPDTRVAHLAGNVVVAYQDYEEIWQDGVMLAYLKAKEARNG